MSQIPQAAQGSQQDQEDQPKLVGKNIDSDASESTATNRTGTAGSQPGEEDKAGKNL